MSTAVLSRQEGAVRILINNNPARRNAITPGLYAELPAALAEAVKKILADGELADSMSAANRKLIQNFDAKRVTGEYLKLLAELEA